MRGALVIVTCLIAAACSATDPGPRARASGFGTEAGVADPYGDGKEHLLAGRYQIAIERFGQALARDGRSLGALNGLAIAHTRLGRFEVAQGYFERALQIDATSALTLNNYGWSLIEQGRLRDGKPFLEQALQHAAAGDVPIVAANLESMGQARASALISALEQGNSPGAASGQRLIRVAAGVYRLEATPGPGDGSEPATVADHAPSPRLALRQHPAAAASPDEGRARAATTSAPVVIGDDVDAAEAGSTSAEPSGDAGPGPDRPPDPQFGPAPVDVGPQSGAAALLPGENT